MRGRVAAVILLLLGAFQVEAQAQDTLRGKYIKRYPDYFFVWPVLKHRSMSFDVSSDRRPDDNLSFLPNNSYSFGVGAYLFDVSAEVSLSIPLDEKSTERFGISEARDLSTSLMGRYWAVDAFVQRYESFYLSNPVPNIPANKPFPLRPDITLTNFGVTGMYVFNKNKFSLWSAYNFSERQLMSKGSALMAWTINNVHLSADSVVLASNYLRRLNTSTNFREIRYATFSVAPGYSYNVIWRKLFFNISLAVGPAHHWVYYVGSDGVPHYDISINSFVDTRVALGYSSDRWFGGITFVSQARAVKFEEITLQTQSQSFRMVVGYRILEKGLLKKTWKEFFPATWRRYM
ncbi:MAG TPA: DUF4421 family protein [Cyclobacteriaceae bacterium]|nr:DUF4421 family protein [Cyclobacteriaceae bacterium]